MTEPDPPPLKRLKLNRTELEEMTKEEIVDRWLEQDQYVDVLEARNSEGQRDSLELVGLRESEDKLRQQQLEATRRENLLVMRLAAKEQEMQEYASQIQDLKLAQTPGSAQLRSTLLDPAVNLMFESMKKELNSTKAKLEETQNELSAWKFTPDSNTGKRLMAKCRLLYQENEELGKMISTGRIAKLEGDLALHKNFSEEMKKSQTELDEFLLELDEDVEAMQSTILFLQQQLRESKEQTLRLQNEIQRIQIDQVRPTMDSVSLLTNSPKHSPLSATAFEMSENFPTTPPLTNHIKTNGNVNGQIVANGQEIESVDSLVNNSTRVAGTGNKNNCDNLNSRAHSPVHTGRSNSVASSPSSDENRLAVDEECWPEPENNSTRDETATSTEVSGVEPASPSDDKLTIEEQLQAMEECDSLDSAHTPPLTSAPAKDAVTADDKETTEGENVDGKGCLGNERVAVNGGVDGISSVSDDDL